MSILFLFFSSCKRCETRYEPDFTEDELSWVRFEKDTVKYQVRYKDGANWKVDTIIAVHRFSGVHNTTRSEGKCEENIVYKNADDDFNIEFPNGNGFGNLGCYIKNDNEFSVYITAISAINTGEPRTDTAVINGITYYDVYKGYSPSKFVIISKKIGILLFRNMTGEEIQYLP